MVFHSASPLTRNFTQVQQWAFALGNHCSSVIHGPEAAGLTEEGNSLDSSVLILTVYQPLEEEHGVLWDAACVLNLVNRCCCFSHSQDSQVWESTGWEQAWDLMTAPGDPLVRCWLSDPMMFGFSGSNISFWGGTILSKDTTMIPFNWRLRPLNVTLGPLCQSINRSLKVLGCWPEQPILMSKGNLVATTQR